MPRRRPHHSFGQVIVHKVLPGDLSSSIPEEEIIGDCRPESHAAQDEHPELFVVPGDVALTTNTNERAASRLSTCTHPALWLRPH